MARKAMWMVVLLVALFALSIGAVFASNLTRPAEAAAVPKFEYWTAGSSSGYSTIATSSYDDGDCPFSHSGETTDAY